MKNRFFTIALFAAAMLSSACLSYAIDANVTPDANTSRMANRGSAKESPKDTVPNIKTSAKTRTIDINTATETELKAIPGIGTAYAAKIITGRPYANKAQLKSRKILPGTTYEQVKERIIARTVKK